MLVYPVQLWRIQSTE